MKSKLLLSLLSLTFFSSLLSEPSLARGRSVNFSNSRGGSGTHNVHWNNGFRSSNSTYITTKGRTYNSVGSGTYDRGSRTYTGSNIVTGPNGNSRAYQAERQALGNKSYQTTITGPKGNERVYNSQYTHDKTNNTITKNVTRPNGQSRDYTTQYSPNDGGGWSYNTTGPKGNNNGIVFRH